MELSPERVLRLGSQTKDSWSNESGQRGFPRMAPLEYNNVRALTAARTTRSTRESDDYFERRRYTGVSHDELRTTVEETVDRLPRKMETGSRGCSQPISDAWRKRLPVPRPAERALLRA